MSGSMDPGLPRWDQLVFIPKSVQVIHDDVEIVSSSEGAAVPALLWWGCFNQLSDIPPESLSREIELILKPVTPLTISDRVLNQINSDLYLWSNLSGFKKIFQNVILFITTFRGVATSIWLQVSVVLRTFYFLTHRVIGALMTRIHSKHSNWYFATFLVS